MKRLGQLLCAAALCASFAPAPAADKNKELLSAARNGDAAQVRALLDSGASIETSDKNKRTPLILAASNGYAETVRLLLERGANPEAREKSGLTAFGVALFSSGGPEREGVLTALPRPPRLRLAVNSAWLPVNVGSSCFMSRPELAEMIGGMRTDATVAAALVEYARTSGRDLVEIVRTDTQGVASEPPASTIPNGADSVWILGVRPGVKCVRETDSVTLAIDLRVVRSGGSSPIFSKTYGAGLKGMHAQSVTNAKQYQPFLEQWAKSHADSIYWDAIRAHFSTPPRQ